MIQGNKQNMQVFEKKSSQEEFDFFYIKLPYETRTSLFHYLPSNRNSKLIHFVAWNVNLNWYFNKEYFKLKKKYTKSEQNHAKYAVFTQKFNLR